MTDEDALGTLGYQESDVRAPERGGAAAGREPRRGNTRDPKSRRPKAPDAALRSAKAHASQTPSRKRGRPADTRLGEDLAVLATLSRGGATGSAEAVASLLRIDRKRAREILDMLGRGRERGGGPSMPFVPLYATEDGAVSRVDAAGPTAAWALRLTNSQAEAVSRALDVLGLDAEDRLRKRLEEAFFPLAEGASDSNDTTPAAALAAGAQSPGCQAADVPACLETLLACARSVASGRRDASDASLVSQVPVTFSYQGDNDAFPRSRRAVPRGIRLESGRWLVDAYDLDARGARTFLATRMRGIELEKRFVAAPRRVSEHPDGGYVTLSCTPAAARRVRTWDGARPVGQREGRTLLEVPYYRVDWLPRHVLALGPEVTHDSPELADEMRAIAHGDLQKARRYS